MPGSKHLARCNAMVMRPTKIKVNPSIKSRMQKLPVLGELIALGIPGCLRIATGRLTLSQLCRLMEKILGCTVEIPILDDRKLAFDIDSKQDWSVANYELRGGGVPIFVEQRRFWARR